MTPLPVRSAAPADRVSFTVVAGLVRAADLLLLGLAAMVSIALATWLQGAYPRGPVELAATAATLAVALSLSQGGAYAQLALTSAGTQVRLLFKPLLIGGMVLIAYLFTMRPGYAAGGLPGRAWPVLWVACAALLLAASRFPLARLMQRWTAAGRLARTVAIVGLGDFSREFIERLQDEPDAYRIVGLYDDRHTRLPSSQLGVGLMGSVADLVQRSRREKIDVIVVALPLSAADRIKAVMDELGSTVADIVLTTDLAGLRYARTQFAGIGGNAVVSVREAPLKDLRAIEKLMLDYGVGVLALLTLWPLLLAAALLIRLDSPGPVLFKQPRMGFNNRLFVCCKFRTMHHGMADRLANRQTTRGDPRITRVGRVLRKLSIDELPQLFNVMNGTMSLVGPRPHAPHTKAADRLFADVVRQYALRHRVKPGITGWAQVNGWRGETATEDQIAQRVACDLFYIEHWSVGFDVRIMAMTLLREIRSRHAF